MIAALLVGAVLAQEPGFSLLFQINDPDGLLQGDPQLTLTDAAGTAHSHSPRDDGQLPDIAPGDGLYAQPIFAFQGARAEVVIGDGQRTWQGSSAIATDSNTPMLVARLRADGTLDFSDSPPPSASPEAVSARPEVTGSEARVRLGWGYGLWAVLMAAGGVAAARGGLRLRAAALAPAQLSVQPPAIAPRRIAAEDCEAVCAALLQAHRVVVLGPPLPGTIACLDARPLPGELVAAVAALALSPGRSVALLVTDIDRLPPARDRVADLEAAVGQRFPLVIVAPLTAA